MGNDFRSVMIIVLIALAATVSGILLAVYANKSDAIAKKRAAEEWSRQNLIMTAPTPDFVIGMKIFRAKGCNTCHLEADNPAQYQGAARASLPALRSRMAKDYSQEKFRNWILNGGKDMPAYRGIISDDEILWLYQYLRSRSEYSGL